MPEFRPIPRRILAQFLTDFEAIKIFEQLQQSAGITLPTTLEEVFNSSVSAEAKAAQALAELSRIAEALELLAAAPFQLPAALPEAFIFPSQPAKLEEGQQPPFIPCCLDACYGSAYANNISVVIAVAAANTAYELTSGLTVGTQAPRLMSFGGGHYLALERNGVYLATWSLSIDTSTALDEIEGGLMIDGAASNEGTAHTTVSAATDASTIAGSAILGLAALNQISLFIRNHTAARDITVEHASLSLVKIGEL